MLRALYYNPRTGLSSLGAFYVRAKKEGFTRRQVAEFLAKQEVFQQNKQQPKKMFFPIIGAPHSYQADLMFMDAHRGYKYILSIIDVNTRKAWVVPLKLKSDTPAALVDWLGANKVKVLQVDAGSEFNNKTVKNYMSEHNMQLRTVATGLSTDQGKVERFNGTLRRLITLYLDAYKTLDWVTPLQALVENYNSRFHSALGTSPNEAKANAVRKKDWQRFTDAQKYFDSFAIGERVRALVNKDPTFSKGRQEWSRNVYTIDDIANHQFHLAGKGWHKSWEVQKIPDELEQFTSEEQRPPTDAVRKAKKVVRNLSKEGIRDMNVVESSRQTKAPVLFEAGPAPDPRTLVRPVVAVKNPRGSRLPKPEDVKYVQTRGAGGKFIYGKVVDGVARYSDGTQARYSPEELVAHRFPITKADKANFLKVVKSLEV